jgi:hypothetical protein
MPHIFIIIAGLVAKVGDIVINWAAKCSRRISMGVNGGCCIDFFPRNPNPVNSLRLDFLDDVELVKESKKKPYSNRTCYTYTVQKDNTCSSILVSKK